MPNDPLDLLEAAKSGTFAPPPPPAPTSPVPENDPLDLLARTPPTPQAPQAPAPEVGDPNDLLLHAAQGAKESPQIGPDSPTTAQTAPKQAPQGVDHYALTRGVIGGLSEQNPELIGQSLEGLSHAAPDLFKGTLTGASDYFKGLAQTPAGYEVSGKSVFDANSLSEALTSIGEQVGQGIASSIPPFITGGAGLVAGAGAGLAVPVIGPELGGAAGLAIGAGSSSFLFNHGDVYQSLKQEGVAPEEANRLAIYAAIPMAALDTALPASLLAKFGGLQELKRGVARGIAKRVAQEAGKGVGIEGVTEAAQQVIQEYTVDSATGKPFFSPETLKRSAEAGLVGGLTGGLVAGGLSTVTPDRTNADFGDKNALVGFDAALDKAYSKINQEQPGLVPTPPVDTTELQLGTEESRAATAPVFYSQVRKVAEEKLPRVATQQQVLQTLRNAPGVKEEELTTLGIPEWLAQQGPKVSKQDLLTEIAQRQVQIQEITLGPKGALTARDWTVEPSGDITSGPWLIRPDNVQGAGFAVYENGSYVANYPTEEFAKRFAAEVDGGSRRPRFGEYTLPGGSNYREVLLTLPELRSEKYGGHFGQGEFAHMRLKDRTDAEGNKTLFVEEIQSDLHQRGRRLGYRASGPKLRAIEQATEAAGLKLIQALHSVGLSEDQAHYLMGRIEDATAGRGLAPSEKGIVDNALKRPELNAAILDYQEKLREEFRASDINAVPDAPFKGNWEELAFKRILRMAADGGYDRVAWTNGDVQVARYPGVSDSQAQGLRNTYDRTIPKLANKWGKKLRAKTGTTEFPDLPEGLSSYIDISPELRTNAQTTGFPYFNAAAVPNVDTSYSTTVEGKKLLRESGKAKLVPATKRVFLLVQKIAEAMNIQVPIKFRIVPDLGTAMGEAGKYLSTESGELYYKIDVALNHHNNAEEIYSTAAHELGHIIFDEHYESAPSHIKNALDAAFQRWFDQRRADEKFLEMIRSRDNFVMTAYGTRGSHLDAYPLASLSPEDRQYWLSKEEFMAEQTARWATTSEKPISLVEKYFSALAARLKKLYEWFKGEFKQTAEPDQIVKSWLDSLAVRGEMPGLAAERATRERTQAINQRAFAEDGAPDTPATEQTVEGDAVSDVLMGALPPEQHGMARSIRAGVDRFNKFYKWMISLPQLAALNLHLPGLQMYKEEYQLSQLERAELMLEAQEKVLKPWGKLGETQELAMTKFLDDYMNKRYLTDEEWAKGVVRQPTRPEFESMARRHGLDERGLQVFENIRIYFDKWLGLIQELLVQKAQKIEDPVAQAQELQNIQERMANYRKGPYMPAMRFGNYTVSIRDEQGNLTWFGTFETKRQRARALETIKGEMLPGDRIQEGYLPKEAQPLMGMPPELLDSIGEKLDLSPKQREALSELRYQLSPVQSFRHRLQKKKLVPGYSMDFKRAFANYAFHGANFYTRVKHIDALRAYAKSIKDSAGLLRNGTKRLEIYEFVKEHLDYMSNPKSDWAALRSITAVWALGASPAAASLNLTQMIIGSYPFLSRGFGDVKTLAAMSKAGLQLSTYYRKGTLEGMTELDLAALSEAVQEGIVTEAQATELAAMSEVDNLKHPFRSSGGGKTVQKSWEKLRWAMEKSMFFFQMSEQMNRRITFRAAFKLAMENPNSRLIQEALTANPLQYERLLAKGGHWNHRSAAAFVTAKQAVESTQFIYQQWANPRFIRGKLRSVFIFKTFLQNTLFMLYNYPAASVRSLLVMAALGGLMGLPGAEDMKGVIKAIGWQFFGKDFDIDREVREFVQDIASDSLPADLILHGAARVGFGIPQVMDALGVPFPEVDRSRAIGLGQISPVDVGVLFGPNKDPERAISESTQRASGAAFGLFFNVYKALTDTRLNWDDAKRWERAFPRSAGAISKAFRLGIRGREETRSGSTVVRFDISDPKQMAEVLAQAGGYQSTRLSRKWDALIAQYEAVEYWNLRRGMLLNQAWAARRSGDKEAWTRMLGAIKKFNTDLPPEARTKAITRTTLVQSFQNRAKAGAYAEVGLPASKSDIPLARYIQSLYPEAEVDVRKVK